MLGPCLNPLIEGCRPRKSIGHHLYWPRRNYQTELEQAFREKPEHIIQICACAEWLIHNAMRPPEKPPVEEMIVALTVEFNARQNNVDSHQLY